MRTGIRTLIARIQNGPASPVSVRHSERSMLLSMDDDPTHPDDALMDLALGAVEHARHASMVHVVERMTSGPCYPDVWPGEHYKLLAGLVQRLKPQLVIEVGTYTGMSALAMLPYLPENGRLITFDLVPWNQVPGTLLNESDFAGGRLQQVLGNLGDSTFFSQHAGLMRNADLFFIDGPKDGSFEDQFLKHLEDAQLNRSPLLVFDDTRLWNMLRTWRTIRRPKLDLTSFGHWSGTGLVHWTTTPSTKSGQT